METEPITASPLISRLAWGILWLTVVDIVAGSLVRATGSGAGCGDSWPRCGGSLFPLDGPTEQAIELSHRAITAVLGLGLVAFLVLVWRSGLLHGALRRGLTWVAVFFVGEVLIGALLVLAGWVDEDASLGRITVVPLHLVNTFFLIGAMVLVAHAAKGGGWPKIRWTHRSHRIGIGILVALLIVGASGALNALADTLHPANTLLGGLGEELEGSSPWLVRLRILHPFLAVIGAWVTVAGLFSPAFDAKGSVRNLAVIAASIVGIEVVVGLVNVALLTPVEVQLIHLLVAEALWIVATLAVVRVVGASAPVRQMEPA